MRLGILSTWISPKLKISNRLIATGVCYIVFLMTPQKKHSLKAAAVFFESDKSRFSKFLKNNPMAAVATLNDLSKKQAKQFSKIMKKLADGALPWDIAILIDSTIQNRSSLYPENSKKFNHGKGFTIGHQWTNIVLIINDMLIPLQPISFYNKKYCRENKIAYKTENEKVIDYINNLNLNDYIIGPFSPDSVIVLADSGYDDHRIESIIAQKQWNYIIALNKTRSIKTEGQYYSTKKSDDWNQISELFRRYRCVGWQTIRVPKNSGKNKRMEFRIRQITGYLRSVGKAQLICSEFKKRSKGRRKYLACNDLKVKARQIIIGYRLRWEIEIFHKAIKMHLGFEDVATKSFASVMSHVHWVYCAYLLLNGNPPGIPKTVKSILEKQNHIKNLIKRKKISRYRQILTQIDGDIRLKSEFQRVLETPLAP